MTNDHTNTGLTLHTSNRLESLAMELATLMHEAPSPPLQPEVIIVQSQGMARWLQLELASRLGLCANVRFPFPRAFAREIFRAFDPDLPEFSQLDPAHLTWRIWSVLPELRDEPDGEAVERYLTDDSDGRKRYQLASRLAGLLDDYAIFRPELVLAWEQERERDAGNTSRIEGDSDLATVRWQARLWRKIRAIPGDDPPAILRQRFVERLERTTERPAGLPSRVALFGISALPPFYVDLFERLGRWSAVHVFLLQPSALYWGDQSSAKAALRRGPRDAAFPSALHAHEGNPLLASLGGQGRDFLNVLLATTDFNNLDQFTDPGDDTLLHSIQSNILNLRNPGADGARPMAVPANDDSIVVSSCHSPVRELEVLQDHLLRWLADDTTLTPRDILVLTPDIETYAPLIDAVFSAPPAGSAVNGAAAIPFSVADRSTGAESPIVGTFLRILRLAGSRLGAASVLELLQTPALRRRFEIGEAESLQAREWLLDAGVRWGRDEAHRESLKLPALRANTWADGLDRLLLGYAMTGDADQLFHELLPCDGPEGHASDVLGRLLEFTRRTFATIRALEAPRPLSAWPGILRAVIADFFAESEADEPDLRLLRDILSELDEQARRTPTTEPVPLSVILEYLDPVLAEDRIRGGFLTGRVTFAALKPMRSIPFKIICLLGLNDSGFPRADTRLSFDLMAAQPRLGDQSKREDDRYLFLETLLSARRRLYLSYVGQSIRDNSSSPPSVLVSELLDYIDQSHERAAQAGEPDRTAKMHQPAKGQPTAGVTPLRRRGSRRPQVPDNQLSLELPGFLPASEAAGSKTASVSAATSKRSAVSISRELVFRHRLQAFSADYFKPASRLFSHSAENFQACRALSHPLPSKPFVTRPLPEPEEAWRTVDVDALASFFVNPGKFFLTRLDVRLPHRRAELSESEPMELEPSDYFDTKTELITRRLAGEDLAALRPVYLRNGRWPLGPMGAVRYGELCEAVEEFCERLARYGPNERIDAPGIDVTIAGFRVMGRFQHVTPKAVLYYRSSVVSPKDRVRTWIRHLVWCATAPVGYPRESVILGEPGRIRSQAGVRYKPLDSRAARQHLANLLELYWRGLTEPLRFFPKTSLKFAEIDFRNADRGPDTWKDSLSKARQEWETDRFADGERDDAYFKICFHQFDPLDGDFMALARQIAEPLLKHEEPA